MRNRNSIALGSPLAALSATEMNITSLMLEQGPCPRRLGAFDGDLVECLARRGANGLQLRPCLPAPDRDIDVFRFKFEAAAFAAGALGGDESSAGPATPPLTGGRF